jgi:TRAP transporter TAXI family solute receptor
MKLRNLSLAFTAVFALIASTYGQMAILSGSEQASQYQFAEDIVKIVGPDLGIQLSNKSTSGASYNFDQLVDPSTPYKLAIIQADNLYAMQIMDMMNNTNKTKNLKVVLPLSDEQIHFVTKASKGLTRLQDLVKKTVAIGTSDQGTYTTANQIKNRSGIYWSSRNILFEDALKELAMDRIDAFIIVSSAPIQKLAISPQGSVDKLALIPLENFNDWAKYYKADTIRKTDYQWLDKDIPTFSVKSLLVVNEGKLTDEEKNTVMQLKTGILNKYDQLKVSGHPEWKDVNLADWKESDWPMYK